MKNNKLYIFTLLTAVSLCTTKCKQADLSEITSEPKTAEAKASSKSRVAATSIFPGQVWKDNNGVAINAHGGSVFYENGFYHWFGAHKVAGKSESSGLSSGGVHLYRSRDLINWNDFGIVMAPNYTTGSTSDIAYGCRIERPHVVYNSATQKYVCIFKLFLKGGGLNVGYNGVATSSSATGPYTYTGKFIAASATEGSGDFDLYKEGSTVYLVTVRKTDRAMIIDKLNSNYNGVVGSPAVMPNIAISTEAPCVFSKSGTYHLLGSGSTGWNPNPPRYYTSTSITGSWTVQSNPCLGTNPILNLTGAAKTYGAQPTNIIQIQGVENQYIAMMDIWKPTDPINGLYVWLPFRVSNKKLSMNWVDSWNLSWFNNN
jgi:Glycosyl hydrolases family 43